jgi:transcriptional regulator with XRE-family HTH domain
MEKIRDILAQNMKIYRQKLGITQPELAERAKISTNFVGMIEQKRKFPAPEILDRIAVALEIETSELFSVPPSATNELELLRNDIINEVKTLNESLADITEEIKIIKNYFEKENKKQKK